MKLFDRKFGKEFMASLPPLPGVYRIFDPQGALIYVGKAKNLRRRLSQYRNAKRRKKHLKMRKIVTDADRIEFEVCENELEACLREAKLIQELRPKWNVAGAFYFLYPMVGIRKSGEAVQFCYTTEPEKFSGFQFHGAFRSRSLTRLAFWSMIELFEYVAHRLPRDKKAIIPKYSYVIGFRRFPDSWIPLWESYFRGESLESMEELVLALVENAGARRQPKDIQKLLNGLKIFWRHESLSLRKVIRATAFCDYPVPQRERDVLYVMRRYQTTAPIQGAKNESRYSTSEAR